MILGRHRGRSRDRGARGALVRDPFAAAYSDTLLIIRADASRLTLSGSNVVAVRPAFASGGYDITPAQGTPANGPTVLSGWSNGRDALRFTATNSQYLLSGAYPGGARAQPTTIYVVFDYRTSGTLVLFDSFSAAARQQVNTAALNLSMYAGASLTSASSPLALSTKYVVAAVYNGATSNLYLNGTLVAGPGTASTQSINGICLGASYSTGAATNHWDGAVAFWGLCAGAHDASTVAARTTYLRSAAQFSF
jgi:hypothetical protein